MWYTVMYCMYCCVASSLDETTNIVYYVSDAKGCTVCTIMNQVLCKIDQMWYDGLGCRVCTIM